MTKPNSEQIYTPAQISMILDPVFRSHHVKRAVLFGSYAKGIAERESDIDIMVDSGLRGLAFFGLLEDVVTVLKKEVDLIDTSQIRKDSPVDKEIRNTGITIYE